MVSGMRTVVEFIKAGSGWQSLGQEPLGTGQALVFTPFVGSSPPTCVFSLHSKQ